MSIGERITELRKEKGVSQVQLAKALEVTRQAVSKWENDLTAPDTINLIQLADVLDTDVEYLATGSHSKLKASPEIITVVKTVENVVEKIVEKPVVVEKIVEIEKAVETVVEKPVLKKITRVKISSKSSRISSGRICGVRHRCPDRSSALIPFPV